jgi:very-short-patch-repair endonuclease
MTNPEVLLYRRLSNIVKDRYVIFPQIHLSSLAVNKTYGKYHKLGFQRINRRSVDYVLADPETLRAVYAVELDDSTHDTEKGRSIDALKTDVLSQIGMPLVRLRNINSMSDEDIIELFKDARTGG